MPVRSESRASQHSNPKATHLQKSELILCVTATDFGDVIARPGLRRKQANRYVYKHSRVHSLFYIMM